MDAAAAKWHDRDWVSKTAFVAYLRCPYAAWLVYTGQIQERDTLDVLTARLIDEGKAFHEAVVATAERLLPTELHRVIADDRYVFGFPGLTRNFTYGIFGRPDGVRTAHGALLPIEIKSHREVTRLDELELAFYWLLLETVRTRKDAPPLGYVIARVDGRPEIVEVPLKPKRFDEVLDTLAAIRKARRVGVAPRICGCPVCKSSEVRGEIACVTMEGKDLSLIHGIGRHFADRLEALGIRTYEDLLTADPREVARLLRTSPCTVRKWISHAKSFSRDEPVVFGRDRLDCKDMLALDCEYHHRDFFIWLIGVSIVRGGRRQYRLLFADTPPQERRILQEFADLLREHSELPVVTWGGKAADIVHLRNRAQKLEAGGIAEVLPLRHLDAYLFLKRNVHLPIHDFSLKEVAAYFNICRRSNIHNGIEANLAYQEFLSAQGARKARLKRDILRYVRDDLDSLIGVVGRLRKITTNATQAASPGGRALTEE